jgi:hypothetical protein
VASEAIGQSSSDSFILGAMLSADGGAAPLASHLIPGARPSVSVPGQYAARVLDRSGVILSVTTFDVAFSGAFEPNGRREVTEVPIVLSLPLPATAWTVTIVQNGVTIAAIGPYSASLLQAIQSIPDAAFQANPEQRRDALLNKVAAIQRQLAAGAVQGAYEALINDLENSVQNWLSDMYTKHAALEYDKSDVLLVINRIAAHLRRF